MFFVLDLNKTAKDNKSLIENKFVSQHLYNKYQQFLVTGVVSTDIPDRKPGGRIVVGGGRILNTSTTKTGGGTNSSNTAGNNSGTSVASTSSNVSNRFRGNKIASNTSKLNVKNVDGQQSTKGQKQQHHRSTSISTEVKAALSSMTSPMEHLNATVAVHAVTARRASSDTSSQVKAENAISKPAPNVHAQRSHSLIGTADEMFKAKQTMILIPDANLVDPRLKLLNSLSSMSKSAASSVLIQRPSQIQTVTTEEVDDDDDADEVLSSVPFSFSRKYIINNEVDNNKGKIDLILPEVVGSIVNGNDVEESAASVLVINRADTLGSILFNRIVPPSSAPSSNGPTGQSTIELPDLMHSSSSLSSMNPNLLFSITTVSASASVPPVNGKIATTKTVKEDFSSEFQIRPPEGVPSHSTASSSFRNSSRTYK